MVSDRFLPSSVDPSQVTSRIGLVSDTHMPERCAELPPSLFEVMDGVDLLLHAGDVGALWVLERMSAIAPVVAVHGNDTTPEAQRCWAGEYETLTVSLFIAEAERAGLLSDEAQQLVVRLSC